MARVSPEMDAVFPYLSLLGASACVILGIFVVSRNPRNTANIAFAFGMTALAVMEAAKFLWELFPSVAVEVAAERIRLGGELLLPVAWLLFSTRTIQSASRRSAWSRRTGLALVALLSTFFFLTLVSGSSVSTEIAGKGLDYWLSVFLILSLTAVLGNFEATLRSADHAGRWKLKFLFLGIGAILAVRIFIHSQRLLFPASPLAYQEIVTTVVVIGCALVAFSLLRHQLLDVNVFVSRYFAYNSFAVIAVGIYLLAVGVTAGAVREFGGSFSSYGGILFVLLSVLLLITALLSTTVRKRVQIFINRNFYRSRYDYQKEWLEFTENLSSKLDARDIFGAIRELFSVTLWTEGTRLWLCDEREGEFIEVGRPGGPDAVPARWDPAIVLWLKERGYPVAIEDPESEVSADAFVVDRQKVGWHGISVLVPLITADHLVGVLGCAKSRSGRSYDREDFDLMNTAARQAANSFLIARLSERLVRAKEMEAFHAFSAFVLHDMKNFVSMLSLVVQNADRNLDNPEFRKDAMRSISQTVEKMTRMMERLAALAREPGLAADPVDLNGLVREVAAQMKGAVRSRVVEEFDGLVPVVADAAGIRKVITNLIMNAEEATAAGVGEIRLSTCTKDGKAVFAVSDNGCGMTPEFVSQSLFKPFATTKSHGFGIGLYQVKRIVEAHQGMIEVDSAVGRGTTVRVLLPQGAG